MKYVIPLFFIIALIGCSQNNLENNTYYQLAQAIERSISNNQWDEASKQVQSLKIYYDQNEWRLEKIVKEKELLELEQELNGLFITIEDRDKEKSDDHLSTFKRYAKEIYSDM